MRWRSALLAALSSSAGLAVLFPAAAAASPVPAACATSFDLPGARCGTVTVPLDRSGAVGGNVKLFYERLPAAKRSRSTIAVFPGGPGAATSILGYDVMPIVRRSLADHDLLLLDQRGTGRSGYVDCDRELAGGDTTMLVGDNSRVIGKGVQRCAKKLGARRSFYTTRDTVEDLEAVRKELGIDKFVLLGVSYGTLEAAAYARAYPQHVDRIVLDSLVSEAGLDAFGLHTVEALPRLLRQLCRGGGCDRITSDPVSDLETLVARLEQGPLRSHRPVRLAGCETHVAITRSRLFGLFSDADEDPKLLAQLPVAIHEAAAGRPYQLSLLLAVKSPKLDYCTFLRIYEKLFPGRGLKEDAKLAAHVFSSGEQVARLCEETRMPWPRQAPPSTRGGYAQDALTALGAPAFMPFDRATVLSASLVSTCKFWPAAADAPAMAAGPLPDVPVLILAGLDDLRTPAEDALALASATPRSQLLLVPDVGHSTLTTSGCARRGFARFMRDQLIGQCHRSARHSPAPARNVEAWQNELQRLLEKVPRRKPGNSARRAAR